VLNSKINRRQTTHESLITFTPEQPSIPGLSAKTDLKTIQMRPVGGKDCFTLFRTRQKMP
jgi:hypothetical protein